MQSRTSYQSSGGQVNEPAALLSRPLEGEIVTDQRRNLVERLEYSGVSSLSDADLLSLILRTGAGNERRVGRVEELLATYSVPQLLQLDFGTFSEEYGLGKNKAAQLQAVLEVARRLLLPPPTEKYQIASVLDVVRLVAPDMAFLDHEELRGLYLDTKNTVVANLPLYKGTVNSSVLRSAEILRPAITRNCPHLVLVHNHPSHDPFPSPEDRLVTQELVAGAKLLEIEVLDHIIIGDQTHYTSLKETMAW